MRREALALHHNIDVTEAVFLTESIKTLELAYSVVFGGESLSGMRRHVGIAILLTVPMSSEDSVHEKRSSVME